jgi:hypothetical protein
MDRLKNKDDENTNLKKMALSVLVMIITMARILETIIITIMIRTIKVVLITLK